MKIFSFLSAPFLVLGMFFLILLSGGFFLFSAEGDDSATEVIPKEETDFIECPANTENEYYKAATEDEGKISSQKAIDLFSENQNDAFSEYIAQFSGASLTCGLSRLGEDAMTNLKTKTPQKFSEERLLDLRHINCALFALHEDGRPFACPEEANTTYVESTAESFGCDVNERLSLQEKSKDLSMTMKILLEEIDELVLAYPLHKQLECVHEELLKQREKMIAILKFYSAIRFSHPAATDR